MLELKLITDFPREIIATDEVGRGPLGGPVVVGAVRLVVQDQQSLKKLLNFLKLQGIKDSKKMKTKQRLELLEKLGIGNQDFRRKGLINLKGLELSFITWEMCHQTIDSENILASSLRGMKEAAQCLSQMKKKQTTLLIDGHLKLRWTKESPWTEIPVVQGDSKSLLIGLASLIAKEKRDAYMRQMHVLYPEYGFNTHFGYPTAKHRSAIREYGPSPIHRKTFKGVKEFLRP
jgi:ribonuclease HII